MSYATIFKKNKVYVVDHHRPEYLDGAQMQFTVGVGAYPDNSLAYFDNEEDALLFAKAKARRRARVAAHKCAKRAPDTADNGLQRPAPTETPPRTARPTRPTKLCW